MLYRIFFYSIIQNFLLSQLISSQWDGVLGTAEVIVTSEPVAPGDLSVHLVGGLGLSVTSSSSNPSVITVTVNSHNTLYNHGQVSPHRFGCYPCTSSYKRFKIL